MIGAKHGPTQVEAGNEAFQFAQQAVPVEGLPVREFLPEACLARREALDSQLSTAQIDSQESISENRFLAARDGIEAELIDSGREARVPVPKIVDRLVAALRPHAQELGCEPELEYCLELARENGAVRQRRISREVPSLAQMVSILADELE